MSAGGAERVALTLIQAFVEAGHAIDLLLARREGELLPILPPGVRVIDLGAPRFRDALRPLVRYFRECQPDAVQVSMWPLTIVAILAHKLARSKSRIVVSDHAILSLQYSGKRLPWVSRTIRLFYPWGSGRVAVSAAVAEDLCKLSGLKRDQIDVIHNPLPPPKAATRAERSAPEAIWATSNGRILAVGVIKSEKNFPLLLKAVARLAQKRQVKLVIVGDGPQRRDLEGLIEDQKLGQAVHLAGYQSSLTAWYESADLLALSSDQEGFANVLVEAMRSGLPVVSTDCGGPREILEDGEFGQLVPVGDVDALAKAMERVLDNPPDGELLKRRAEELSGSESIRKYEALLLGGRVMAERDL